MTKRKRSVLVSLVAVLFVLGAYLTFWPVPIDPVAWEPPPPPALIGLFEPNEALRASEILGAGAVHGPEDVAIARDGRLFVGTHDGKIVALDGDTVATIAETGGRPLGLAWDREDNLIIADAVRGLLRMSKDGALTTLTTESNGVPFRFTDDVDVAADGRIYFSDASSRFGYGQHMEDLVEGRASGRLLRYDPKTGATETLVSDLAFANGVALAPDDSFVLVNETGRYRIHRHFLSGAKAGQTEVFYENLPGLPDGISRSPRGTYWVALFTVRNAAADAIAPHPFLKSVLFRLPSAWLPKPAAYGFVIELDGDGKVLRSLQDPGGAVIHTVTSVEEHEGALFLGTLHEARVGKLRL